MAVKICLLGVCFLLFLFCVIIISCAKNHLKNDTVVEEGDTFCLLLTQVVLTECLFHCHVTFNFI